MSKTIIYKYNVLDESELKQNINNHYTVKIWKPGFNNFIPPGKGRKYFIYWLFHYLHIFKNRGYSALLVYENDLLIASMLIVPPHFKWPFMAKDDLQFTYVMTDPEYRGKGIGEIMLRCAIREFYKKDRTFWYVTDKTNVPSVKLCEKVGFTFYNYGFRSGILKILRVAEDGRQDQN